MIFNSLEFAIFFIVVTSAYFILPHKFRWALLLFSSCYFYMAFVPIYILILGFTIVIDYYAGIFLEDAKGKNRKMYLVASLVANIGILCIFKYFNFLNDNLSALLGSFDYKNPVPYLKILLPIGLSFHTFQAMSYTIEVYRGNQKAERNFGIYALYVMFYPQLVAGPIERPQNLLHQFYEKHTFDYPRVVEGLKQMLKGFLKKLVVADRVAIYVDTIYNTSAEQSGKSLAVATVFFAFQIYCDFSAYSDIAIGAARVMGFDLMNNFNRPYFSRSIGEFWRRWHISLSTWFKDYLYFPLGGSRVKVPRLYFNLMLVFIISGLWHGANWTYIIWGALNGLFLIGESLLRPTTDSRKWWVTTFNILLTFVLINCTWVFFRANTAAQAFQIIKDIAGFKGNVYLGNPKDHFFYSVAFIALLMLYEFKEEFLKDKIKFFHNSNSFLRYSYYVIAIVMIMLFGVFNGGQFIYFQF